LPVTSSAQYKNHGATLENPATPQNIASIAVLGAGTMGHGIAQVAALAGYRVILRDVDLDAVARGVRQIERNLDKGIQRAKLTEAQCDSARQHIHGTTQMSEVAQADLIIEAVPEVLALKQNLLRELESLSQKPFVFASNTSSLSIAAIAQASRNPAQVIGMHFFNPVHIMRLLEIVVGPETGAATLATARAVAQRLKKEPITVKDVPGFASSRLGIALGMEAIRMVEQGVASPQDIDKAMELGYNHPMGPLKLTDLVGLDVRLNIAEYLHQALGSEVFHPPALLRQMVNEGKLGKKSGHGFYNWED
jgi:3-hydroxybutyryl-CoA dehydrogenase